MKAGRIEPDSHTWFLAQYFVKSLALEREDIDLVHHIQFFYDSQGPTYQFPLLVVVLGFDFQELGIDTFLWMVNSKYMKKIGEDLGFTWMTTDFYDEIGY